MRYINWIYICCIGLLPAFGMAEEFRIFTAADGRVIEARIVEYNPARKKLRIERRNGRTVWIEPRVFSEADREYILSWIQSSEFLSTLKVRITIERHKKSQGKSGDDVHFSVTINNRTDSDLNNLIFDYRLYIEGEGVKNHQDEERCEKGRIKLDHLAAGERKTIKTKTHRMVERYDVYTSYSTDQYGNSTSYTVEEKVWDDDDRGIWFRISGPELEGKPLVREEWYPKELNKRVAWIDEPQQKRVQTVASSSSSSVIKEAEKYLKGNGVEKDAQKALEMLMKAYEKTPSASVAERIGRIYMHNPQFGDLSIAETWMDKCGELGSGMGYHKLSLFYSGNTNESLRDGAKAVFYARKAIELIGEEDWMLSTLACAYARNGQFELAVATAEEAYEKAKKRSSWSDKQLDKFKSGIELFEQGKAWVQGMK